MERASSSRIHREEKGEWVIAPPLEGEDKLRLSGALNALRTRLSKDSGRVPLTDVYQLLADRPFGVRRGLSPLLLAITLVAEGHRIALFERSTGVMLCSPNPSSFSNRFFCSRAEL